MAQVREEGQVIFFHTIDSWNAQFRRGIQSKKPIVVEFTASWCAPCLYISRIVNDLANKMPGVIFLLVVVDELKSVAEDWAVDAMPNFVLIKQGKFVERIVGVKNDELLLAITKHASADA